MLKGKTTGLMHMLGTDKLDLLGGTYAVDLLDILLGWCSGLCLIWTPISLLLVICLLVLLFAVSVAGCLLGYSSCLVVWIPLFLDPSDGAFGRFDLAALCGCRTLNFVCFVCKLAEG